MTRLLDDKVAIITGAGGGLGRAYALLFAREGAKVIVNDYSVTVKGESLEGEALCEQVVKEIEAAGGSAIANHGNVADENEAKDILNDALSAFGRIDILVNNAGIIRDNALQDMSVEDWDALLAVHLRGAFCVTRPVFEKMIEQEVGGVIVNTTSRSGIRGKLNQANYATAKGGLIAFTKVLAQEGAPHGIRSWCISPRAATRPWEEFVTSDGPVTEELRQRFTTEAVATTCLYMVSELSKPHTGKTVFASAESIREARYEGAEAFIPGNVSSAADLATAVKNGQLLFPDEAVYERIS